MTRPPFIQEMPEPDTPRPGRPPEIIPLDEATAVTVPDEEEEREAPSSTEPAPRRGRTLGGLGLRLAAAAATLLLGLALGLAVERLVADLLAGEGPLQAAALVLLGLCGLGILLWIGWEIAALRRLGRVDEIRALARAAAAGSDAAAGRAVLRRYRALHGGDATAWGFAQLDEAEAEARDGEELLALLEITVQRAVDTRCREAITATARRTALVTAISPFALLDMAASAVLNVRLIRRIAELQGCRPGLFATLSLLRRVAGALLFAGGVEAADDYLGELVGAGLLRSVGRRAGEGVVNGMLTIRLGVAAMKVCRPLPYLRDPAPTVLGVARGVFGPKVR